MTLADWRDLAVIALVLFFTVQTVLVIVLVAVVVKLASDVKKSTDAILASTQSTVRSINGTASFVGDTIARPIIKGLSFASGMKRTARALAGLRRGRR